jgi:hypothetical protein
MFSYRRTGPIVGFQQKLEKRPRLLLEARHRAIDADHNALAAMCWLMSWLSDEVIASRPRPPIDR